MKRRLLTIFSTVFLLCNANLQAQTVIYDFEPAGLSDNFDGCGGGFGNVFPQGLVADPTDPTNTVLKMVKVNPSETWGGLCSLNPVTIDLTTDHEICVDFYEEDATGTLLVKLEEDIANAATTWEYQFTTSMGWNTYCIDTNTPFGSVVAAGNVYERLVIFPDFGTCCTDQCYYMDNVVVNPNLCPLTLVAVDAICDANTAGADTYSASFSFSQPTAPGAGTYSLTTTSGGTIGGDNPNMMTTGIMTISGITEGTNADLNLAGGGCDLNALLASPTCLPSYEITFQVNMCEQIDAGTFDPATQAVYVTGGTANQTGFYATCGFAMTDVDGDGVYELPQSYPDGYQILYKFYIGFPTDSGTDNCTGDIAGTNPDMGYEDNLTTCGVGAFGDREYVVNGMDATTQVVCFSSCTDCTNCNCDLTLFAGTATCDAVTSGVDTYEATFTFSRPFGAYPPFTLSTTSGGTIGGDDPNAIALGTITISGIPEGTDADLNLTDGMVCNLNALVSSPSCIPSYDITFQIDMCEQIAAGTFDPATQAVYVTGGTANQSGFYATCGLAMTDADMDGIYEITQTYLDGYQILYKYYIGFPTDAGTDNCTGDIAGTNPDMGFEAALSPCGVGAFGDREYIVNGMDDTTILSCYSSCDLCTSCTDSCPTSYTLSVTETGVADYESSGTISSTSNIDAGASVDYDSATDVILNMGFQAVAGANFSAIIDGCNGGAGGFNLASCPDQIWYEDADGDGLGNPYVTLTGCDQPTGYVETSLFNTGYTTPASYPGYTLVWADEFDNNALDGNTWKHDTGDGCPNVCGWGNNESIWYQSQNATVSDGFLTIEAREESAGGYDYTSSRIKTQGTQSFKYGRIDIRAKLPYSKGLWPALWMLGEDINTVGWPACGEIDIMELIGGTNNDGVSHGTGHWDSSGHNYQGGSYYLSNGIFADEFHVFSIVWTSNQIQWFVDDNLYYTLDTSTADKTEFQNPFFFIFNVSVGGNWPGYPDASTVFPQTMVVDYVRVFQ